MILSVIELESNIIAHFDNRQEFSNRKHDATVEVTSDFTTFLFVANHLNELGIQLSIQSKDNNMMLDCNEFIIISDEVAQRETNVIYAVKNEAQVKILEKFFEITDADNPPELTSKLIEKLQKDLRKIKYILIEIDFDLLEEVPDCGEQMTEAGLPSINVPTSNKKLLN